MSLKLEDLFANDPSELALATIANGKQVGIRQLSIADLNNWMQALPGPGAGADEYLAHNCMLLALSLVDPETGDPICSEGDASALAKLSNARFAELLQLAREHNGMRIIKPGETDPLEKNSETAPAVDGGSGSAESTEPHPKNSEHG